MPYQLALFDWNGTLFNDLAITYDATVHLFRQLAPRAVIPTLQEYREEFSATKMLECYYRRGIPRTIRKQTLYTMWAEHYGAQRHHAHLAEGALRTLRFLAECGIPMAIVSAAPKETINHLGQLGIINYFDRVAFEAANKEETIRALLEKYPRVHPRDAFYVDDTAEGILQAKDAGVAAFGFTRGCNSLERIKAVSPKHIVESFMDVTSIVRANIN